MWGKIRKKSAILPQSLKSMLCMKSFGTESEEQKSQNNLDFIENFEEIV